MKFSRFIATGLILASLITATAFATGDTSSSNATNDSTKGSQGIQGMQRTSGNSGDMSMMRGMAGDRNKRGAGLVGKGEKSKGRGAFDGKAGFLRGKGPGMTAEQKDPIKRMEERKAQIAADLAAGKITDEKAKEITANIDARMAEMKAFDAMTLEQKKEKITKDFKAHLDKHIQDGKLTQAKGDERLKNFTEKLTNWDGNGFPGGLRFGMNHHR